MKMKWLVFIAAVSLAVGARAEIAPGKTEGPKMLKKGLEACGPDIDKFCKDVEPGKGRVGGCLFSQLEHLSAPCLTFARHGGPGHERESLRDIDLLVREVPGEAVPVVIDVRTPEEYAAGHIDGAVNIPHGEIGEKIKQVAGDPSTPLIVYCQSGRRAGIAQETLKGLGYTHVENGGGYEEMKKKEIGKAGRRKTR